MRRRVLLGGGLAGVGMLANLVLIELVPDQGNNPIFVLGLIPVVAGILLIAFGIRCPRCRTNFGVAAAGQLSVSESGGMKFCPFCGVSLDEPMDRKQT